MYAHDQIVAKHRHRLLHSTRMGSGLSKSFACQLFGHVHTCENNTGKDAPRLNMIFPTQYDVGVDNNNFTPISFEQVKQIIEKQVEQFNKNNR